MALSVEETVKGDKTYRNIKIKNLDYATTAKVELLYDEAMSGEGQYGTWYLYNVKLLEPNMGEVSFFAPAHLHKDLEGYKTGSILEITPIEKHIKTKQGEKSYKGYKITPSDGTSTAGLSDTEITEIITALKAENITLNNEMEVRQALKALGYAKEEDVQKMLTAIEQV